MSKKIKVYVVGQKGVDHNMIMSIHKTYEGALKSWHKLRLILLKDARNTLRRYESGKDERHKKMHQKMVKNLSCKDPDKIDNGPHETPYILEWDLEK